MGLQGGHFPFALKNNKFTFGLPLCRARLSLFGGNANNGLKVGRYWNLNNDATNSNWNIGGSQYYRSAYTLRALAQNRRT